MNESQPASGRREPAVHVAAREEQPADAPRSPRWKFAWVVCVLVAAAVGGFVLFRGSGSDHSRFQGDWNYSAAGRNNLGIIRVEGDVWHYRSGGPHGRSYRLTLRPDAMPKEIDLALLRDDGQPATFTHGSGQGGEVKLLGIYEFSGSSLKLALSPEKRPASFEDDEAQVLMLTR